MSEVLQIYATGEHQHVVGESLPDLRTLTDETTGMSFRRIGRFIQLALIGAARCGRKSMPAETAVYLCSARGDQGVTLDIMTQLFRAAQLPKPLSFVNTVSNAACFYVAQALQLRERSNFVCNYHFAFECALQLAALDVRLKKVTSALVGRVDIASEPLHEHRTRLRLVADASIGEGSHWVWLGSADPTRARLGQLLAIENFYSRDELLTWIGAQKLSADETQLAIGEFVSAADAHLLKTATRLNPFDHRSQCAHYEKHSGAAIIQFLRDKTARHLLHVNADAGQRYCAVLVSS